MGYNEALRGILQWSLGRELSRTFIRPAENSKLHKELSETQNRLQQELASALKSLDSTKAQLERGEARIL